MENRQSFDIANPPEEPEQLNQPKSDPAFQTMPGMRPPGQNNQMPQGVELPPDPIGDVASEPAQSHGPSRKLIFTVLGALILIVLAGIAYFMFFSQAPPEEPAVQNEPTTRLNAIWLQQHFGVQECVQQTVCGDDADPDTDGLTNYEEFTARGSLSPNNPDTDGDGLADGDEVHIYKTDPSQTHTSCRDASDTQSVACIYSDSTNIINGYDPLTPGAKMTATRISQIESDTMDRGLHEPTISTLQTALTNQEDENDQDQPDSATQSQTHSVFIEATGFNPPSITINAGDTIVWLNQDSAQHQVASDPHPTHTNLPGFESAAISQSETFSYTFTQPGTVTYHDHLKPNLRATIIVN